MCGNRHGEKRVDLCQHADGCKKRGCFGIREGRKVKARLCKTHAPHDAKMLFGACKFQDCDKYAHYGHASVGKRRFCGGHKEVGMVILSLLIKSEVPRKARSRCSTDDCEKTATYGASRTGPTHCEDHYANNIIGTAVNFTQVCTQKGCRKLARWGDKRDAVPHAFTHCDEHMCRLPDPVPLEEWHERNGPGMPADTAKTVQV
eukprot:TRINITY_DN1531_c0_g1_i2.p1 TRINITY_DN1531_c0_g1~~TRINITY_DN1531_c0_g1_i2.p1  ORF type:complete len:203 (+),score=23.84 TRINITY_DN1531_c0_g1_i2:369-977(+)